MHLCLNLCRVLTKFKLSLLSRLLKELPSMSAARKKVIKNMASQSNLMELIPE